MAYTTWATASDHVNVTQAFGGNHRGKDWNTRNAAGVMGDTMVRAQGDGVVLRSELGTGGNWSWGQFIAIYYPAKNITILTAHHNTRLVTVGQSVTYGTPIGDFGTTGNTTGPHCHEEWHTGRGITNNLVTPEDGFPNVEGMYDLTYGGGSNPDNPDNPSAGGDINLLMVKFQGDGHEYTAAASNDKDGWVYWYNGNFYRCKYTDKSKVQMMGDWNYWMDIDSVLVLGIYNKWLTALPDA